MTKKVILLASVCIILSIVALDSLKHNLYDEIVSFDGVRAVVTKNGVVINGAIQVNAGVVTGYKAERQGDELFISIEGHKFLYGSSEGEFNFDLDVQTKDLTKIYLKGPNPNQTMIIWEKK